jgi:type VI secretion system secreted protein VgrG
MAKLVNTTIFVGSTQINQFSQFKLSQSIFAHHSFKLVCPADIFEKQPNQAPFTGSKDLIGETFTVMVQNFDGMGTPLRFKGVVTQIETNKFSGHIGDIIISGYSPTIIMDNAPHCKTWESKTLSTIVKEISGVFGGLVTTNAKPKTKTPLGFIVQYKETAWQFLNRMAAANNEWLFYNGNNVVFGEFESNTTNLNFGSNLNDFSIAMQLRPVSFEKNSYDYVQNKVYKSKPKNVPNLAGLNDLGKFVHNKSTAFFTTAPKSYEHEYISTKNELDQKVSLQAASQSSNMLRFTGSSTKFDVQLGNDVNISHNNGSYKIIEVTHSCDGQGNYYNDFTAIPASIMIPPVTAYAEPACETQMAVVTKNHDKGNMGRVQVRFHWMNSNENTPWLRVSSMHGGKGKGMHFTPEVGEEVIVGFENGNPTKPFVMGTIYTGGSTTSFGNSGNDVKALQTRSGNKLVLNDSEGSVLLTDKGGADMKFDGAGNVVKNTNKNHTNNTGDVHTINVGKGSESVLKMDKGGNIEITAKTNLKITVGNTSFEMKSDGTIIAGGKIIAIGASEAIAIASPEGSIQVIGKNNHIAGVTKLDNGDVFIN